MKRDTDLSKILDNKSLEDDLLNDFFSKTINISILDEFDSALDNDIYFPDGTLLMGGEWEESYLCIDRLINSQIQQFY